VNEVWFDNVKVPVENLVGEENKGWTYAKYLLTARAGRHRQRRRLHRRHGPPEGGRHGAEEERHGAADDPLLRRAHVAKSRST
jgi:hypothetical protein